MAPEGTISQIVINPSAVAPTAWSDPIIIITLFSGVVTALITGFLGYLTHQYQKKNQQLQEISRKEFDLINRPYLHIDPNTETGVYVENKEDDEAQHIRADFKIKNVGKLPLAYVVEKMTINDQILMMPQKPIVIFPGQELRQWTDPVALPQKVKLSAIMYTASITAKYWPISNPNQVYRRYQKQHISKVDNKNIILEDEAD